MKGLDISKQYYLKFGKDAIHENFPEIENLICVGLAGSGSECYGFDDDVSRDHDFEPGFCIWIPEEDVIDSRQAFKLQRIYDKLPKEFMGLSKKPFEIKDNDHFGVIRFSEFLERHIGKKDANLSVDEWFNIPECALSELVNGEVWVDNFGKFSEIRETLKKYPQDIKLKKLAGSLYIMGQSGTYNYSRCLMHNEKGASQLAITEFVKHTMHAVFLLNDTYMPYYKWSFKAMRKLPLLGDLSDKLEYLLNTDNNEENSKLKKDIILECSVMVIDALKALDLTTQQCSDLGNHAYSVNNKIKDNYIRNADLLAGVSKNL